MRKEITFYVFLGEKRDPSEIYSNSNLRNQTHITQKPSYVYVFHLYASAFVTYPPHAVTKPSLTNLPYLFIGEFVN